MLDERIPECRAVAMVRRERLDVVVVPLDHRTRLELGDRERKGELLDTEPFRAPEERRCTARPPEPHRLHARLQREGLEEPEYAEEVIGMEVREEDVLEREPDPPPHHLPLRPLSAIEQHRLALARERKRRNPAFHGGTRGGRSEEADAEGHLGEGRWKVEGGRWKVTANCPRISTPASNLPPPTFHLPPTRPAP